MKKIKLEVKHLPPVLWTTKKDSQVVRDQVFSRTINKYEIFSLEEAIEQLNSLREHILQAGYIPGTGECFMDVKEIPPNYGDDGYEECILTVSARRLETPEEVTARLEQVKAQRDKEKQQKKLARDAEYQTFLLLKEKYRDFS